MPAADIVVKGAREHNLRSVDVSLPRNKLICLTGVSGSGKSSLAFDTLYAEGQRRYVESLSSFARQFLGQMPKPDVDLISGLSPSISISQKTSGQNPRSTVGTITEIYDYLRVLYARTGTGHCPSCGREITAQTADQIIARVAELPEGTRYSILAPLIRGQKGEYRDLFEDLLKQGFVRARVDGNVVQLTDNLQLDRQMRHNIEVVVDRLVSGRDARGRLAEAVELALKLGDGNLIVATEVDAATSAETTTPVPKRAKRATPNPESRIPNPSPTPDPRSLTPDLALSAHYACTHCGLSFEPPSPQLFSFNSPQGMCQKCDGLGEFYSFDPTLLVPNDKLSMRKGAFELLGPWDDMGRWKRHIYDGVAETMERKLGLAEGTLLDTPWRSLDQKHRDIWLWGTGDEHITFTWRRGSSPMMWGGKFEGLVPELMEKHGSTGSKMQRRQLEKYMSVVKCPECRGERLNAQARSVRLTSRHPSFARQPGRTLPEVCGMAIGDAAGFFAEIELDATRAKIAEEALKEIRGRLGFLINVGLEYLTLDRTAPTLSGGESQRIRLAGQIGCGLVGVLYILDEPSIGLHPRDNDRLLGTLRQLRDLGNTVVVVEHDEDTMRAADHLVDFGPGPGVRGGEVVADGSLDDLRKATKSLTAKYLTGERKIEIPPTRRPQNGKWLKVVGARHNNLKNVDAEIPLGCFVCVTGVSGSGKSSLVNDILVEALHRDLNRGEGQPGHFDRIDGIEQLDKLIAIDQSPIGRTPRSNPATYIKLLDDIRDLYVQLPQSKQRGYKPGRFSFNVSGGRCEACEGNGSNKLEMDFLADVWVTCPVCEGKRFNRETLQVHFKGKSIADVLEMDVQQALEHFENVPSVRHKLQTLHDVGLDYIKLGQPSPTLSGGEAQRVKLARELVKKSTGKTLYLLDEPTTGLHFADIEVLLKVLHNFVDAGNTVLVVEHNLDVLKTADWIIDIGPEGGAGGGRIIARGTPEDVARNDESHTGRSLKKVLDAAGSKTKPRSGAPESRIPTPESSPLSPAPSPQPQLTVRGARQHNLKSIDVTIPRDAMTVCCGMSGSGKTSLAMDTIYAEGQRRYVESLSSYARQFVGQMQKPQLDHIEGLSPAIAIEQKNMGHTPRSTVGTVTEVYDYLRILFARLGEPYCPDCDIAIGTQSADEIIDKIVAEPAGTRALLCAPVDIQVGEKYETLWEDLRADGYARVRVDGQTHTLDNPPAIDRRRKHDVDVVIDRIVIDKGARSRIAGSVENALAVGKGVCKLAFAQDDVPEPRWQVKVHSQHYACDKCGRSFVPLTPHHFSFNSSIGWCESCQGLGTQTGANPAALLNSPKLTLAEGAIAIWPQMGQPLADALVRALAAHAGIPLDRPFDQLSARQRRIIMHGLGEDWIGVYPAGKSASDGERPAFRFQYKGLYPALEEASRLSPMLRTRLEHLVGEVECSMCGGSRLRDDSAAVRFRGRSIDETCRLPLGKLLDEVSSWKLNPRERKIAGEVLREVTNRVTFLVDVGLEYLTLGRPTPTLSGGEAQRIRLAAQVGSGLCGVLYVLDEPTIGLHPRDNRRLLDAMKKLRDLGNTLLVVEHDREVIAAADALLDFGPKAGEFGGEIVASGPPDDVAKQKNSVTGPYIAGTKAIGIPKNRRVAMSAAVQPRAENAKRSTKSKHAPESRIPNPAPRSPQSLQIVGARHNNLRNVTAQIPLGTLTAVAGVSGSGKSSLIEDVLYNALARTLHRAATTPGAHDAIRGIEQINKVIRVDQQPLGNSPSSNPATYTGVFELIRQLFAQLPDAKVRGFTSRRFSFNVPGGRCEACEGNGQKKIEMHFLPDVWVECEACRGRRYNEETLAVRFHGQSIADVLDMSCGRAVKLFEHIPRIRSTLQLLCDVGLDYVKLGQPAPTLSGGEAQRVKLAAELARPDTGRTLYLLDEPTTGLHFEDLAKLLDVLNRLVDLGNTVVVIEHNLDVLKTADWIIEIGPEAGDDGGLVVACGTPEEIVAHSKQWKPAAISKKNTRRNRSTNGSSPDPRPLTPDPCLRSHTGEALAPVLAAGPYVERRAHDFSAAEERRAGDVDINQVGRDAKMPWEVDGRRWHTQDAVDRRGKPVRWEGKVLAEVVDRIHALGKFSDTNWNERSVVEIAAEKKSDGWFFHAITGESWILKLKFRTAKSTFSRDKLIADLALRPYNELPDLPVYGNEPRVKCKNQRGPFQEIEVHVHSWAEIDTPAFWQFLERAVKGFESYLGRAATRPDDIMPWKVLGQKWHFARKGFPPGKRVEWEPEVLEELCELLAETAPEGQFLWNNQQLVHVFVPGQKDPWASILTKKPHAVELVLTGPKNQFAYGQVLELGSGRDFDTSPRNYDQLKLRFQSKTDLTKANFAEFLRNHRASIGESVATGGS